MIIFGKIPQLPKIGRKHSMKLNKIGSEKLALTTTVVAHSNN
jgi:hypothetical protein